MSETEHAGDLPLVVLFAPDHGEVCEPVACPHLLIRVKLTKAVRALGDGAKVFDGEDLEAAGNEFAAKFATDVLGSIGEHLLARPGHTACVVIELDVCREVVGVLLKLVGCAAGVERFKDLGVELGEGLQNWLRCCLCHCLCIRSIRG